MNMKFAVQVEDEFDGFCYLTSNNTLSPFTKDAMMFDSYEAAEAYVDTSDNELVNDISYYCEFVTFI